MMGSDGQIIQTFLWGQNQLQQDISIRGLATENGGGLLQDFGEDRRHGGIVWDPGRTWVSTWKPTEVGCETEVEAGSRR